MTKADGFFTSPTIQKSYCSTKVLEHQVRSTRYLSPSNLTDFCTIEQIFICTRGGGRVFDAFKHRTSFGYCPVSIECQVWCYSLTMLCLWSNALWCELSTEWTMVYKLHVIDTRQSGCVLLNTHVASHHHPAIATSSIGINKAWMVVGKCTLSL